jgi:hypothetical protein
VRQTIHRNPNAQTSQCQITGYDVMGQNGFIGPNKINLIYILNPTALRNRFEPMILYVDQQWKMVKRLSCNLCVVDDKFDPMATEVIHHKILMNCLKE